MPIDGRAVYLVFPGIARTKNLRSLRQRVHVIMRQTWNAASTFSLMRHQIMSFISR